MMDREKIRGFYSLIILGLFTFFLQLAFYEILQEGQEPRLYDTDAYMRLVRVEQLHQTGNWFDNVIHRSNTPYGESSHWTRPLDLLLLAGAWVFQLFTNFHHALLTWGILISPVLQFAGMFAMVWAIAPFIKREYYWHAAALFLWTPATLVPCVAGRPDHHSVLVVLFILEMGVALRLATALLLEQKKQTVVRLSCVLGGLLALSTWTSVESLAVVAMHLGALAILWQSPFIRPQNRTVASSSIAFFLSALFIGSCIALAAEKPFSHWAVIEYDRISIVCLSIFGVLALCAWIIVGIETRFFIVRRTRFIFLAIALTGLAIVVGIFFPHFFRGPYVQMDPLTKEIWLKGVKEIQPIIVAWPKDLPKAILWLGLPFVGVAFLLEQLHRTGHHPFRFLLRKLNDLLNIPQSPESSPVDVPAPDKMLAVWTVCGVGLLIFISLTIFQTRWAYYSGALALFPVTLLLNTITDFLKTKLPSFWTKVVRLFLIILLTIGFLILTAILSSTKSFASETAPPQKLPNLEKANVSRSLLPLCRFLSQKFPHTQRIATFIDFGPEILYRTQHEVIATPYHRNSAGILAVYHLFNAEQDEDALRIIHERNITLLLIQKHFAPAHFCQNKSTTLFNHLLSLEPPSWLHPVELPADLADTFLLFEVQPETPTE